VLSQHAWRLGQNGQSPFFAHCRVVQLALGKTQAEASATFDLLVTALDYMASLVDLNYNHRLIVGDWCVVTEGVDVGEYCVG
jgi:hypothetical protein